MHADKQIPGETAPSIPGTKKYTALFLLSPFLFILLGFLIYLPVINRYFVSDDFKVLYHVCIDHIFFEKGFFRPLSDLSIYLNYQLNGLNPIVFNSFNILIHGLNGWLLYLVALFFCKSSNESKKNLFAVCSSVLFLVYPFHNEAVVWLLGRGASMACLFSLLAIISFYKITNAFIKVFLVCTFYFISIAAFESTILFPLIFILLLKAERKSGSEIRKWTFVLFATLFIHIILRYSIAGSFLGPYGKGFFHTDVLVYLMNIFKTAGRLIFPPTRNPIILSLIFLICAGALIWMLIRNRKKINAFPMKREIFFLTLMLCISCIIPVISGISTQTSETDRALYFPSVFLCLILGSIIVFGFKNYLHRLVIMVLVLLYNLYFLEQNNKNWKKASGITETITKKVREISQGGEKSGQVYFLNIPKEIDGAYVFRQGFDYALKLNNIESTRFVVVNYLSRQDLQKINQNLMPVSSNEKITIGTDIYLKTDSGGCRFIYDNGLLRYQTHPDDVILYWNPDQLAEIQACIQEKPI